MLVYKGYFGHTVFDDEAEIFHGEIINTRDVITFQGDSVSSLKKAFIDSVEDYLDFCAQSGQEPEKGFSGKFNIRIEPEVHRDAVVAAKKSGESLNTWIADAIQHALHTNNKHHSIE